MLQAQVSSTLQLGHVYHIITTSRWQKQEKHDESLKESFMYITSIHIPLVTTLPSHLTTRQAMKWSLGWEEKEIVLMKSQPVSVTVDFRNSHVKPTAVISEYPRWLIEQFPKEHSLYPRISSTKVICNSNQYCLFLFFTNVFLKA